MLVKLSLLMNQIWMTTLTSIKMFLQKEIKWLCGFKTFQQRLKTKAETYKTSKCVTV
jgi:hypothetical protein